MMAITTPNPSLKIRRGVVMIDTIPYLGYD
jgi:hypothetical protein